MTVFYLIRHGEPDWKINDQYGFKGHGRDLPPLTETGVQQALKVAEDERLKNAELIIASPYTRAMQTAAILSRKLDLDLQVEVDLREWQPDLTFEYDSMAKTFHLYAEYQRCNGVYPPGETKLWETREALKKRIDAVLEKYLDYSHVIVVAHSEIIQTQIEVKDFHYCAVAQIEIESHIEGVINL